MAGTAYTLAYDYEGQLTSITQGGNTTSFTYDAIGRRATRAAGGTTTTFQYGGWDVLLEKQGGTTTATYTYGNALLRKDGEYPMFDGLDSERTVTNSSQTVTGTLMLDGFGQTVTSTGSSTDPYMFGATSGYRTEGDAGLMQVGARYYDAQVGRFITRDTNLSQHPYNYCGGDPVNFVDPSGHLLNIASKGMQFFKLLADFADAVNSALTGGWVGGLSDPKAPPEPITDPDPIVTGPPDGVWPLPDPSKRFFIRIIGVLRAFPLMIVPLDVLRGDPVTGPPPQA